MRWLAVSALLLTACGGGGAPYSSPANTTPPPPDDVTQEVITAWADEYEQVVADYETNRQNTERQMAAGGNFSSSYHYEVYRDNCIGYPAAWADGARQSLASAEMSGTTDREYLSDLVEQYRQDFLDYMLASYDYFHQRANLSGNYPAQIRQEIIDGINAVFDDLQADV